MMLMIKKVTRISGISHAFYRYVKANNKGMKNYDENKESSYFKYWNVNNLYGKAMSQTSSVNNFKWVAETPQMKEDFMKR